MSCLTYYQLPRLVGKGGNGGNAPGGIGNLASVSFDSPVELSASWSNAFTLCKTRLSRRRGAGFEGIGKDDFELDSRRLEGLEASRSAKDRRLACPRRLDDLKISGLLGIFGNIPPLGLWDKESRRGSPEGDE